MTSPVTSHFSVGGVIPAAEMRLLNDQDRIFANLRTVIPEVEEQYGPHAGADFARDVADAARYVRQHEAYHRITDIFAPTVFCEADTEATENTEQKEDK